MTFTVQLKDSPEYTSLHRWADAVIARMAFPPTHVSCRSTPQELNDPPPPSGAGIGGRGVQGLSLSEGGQEDED